MQRALAKRNGQHIVDDDAVEIGRLYERSRTSVVESVKLLIEAGKRLAKKKASLAHGEWLPWIEANQKELGFDSDRTARRMIKAYQSNRTLTSDLDVPAALLENKKIWGNDKKRTRNTYQSEVEPDDDDSELEDEHPDIIEEIDEDDPENYTTAYLIRTENAKQFARESEKLTGKIISYGGLTHEIVAAARAAASAWDHLAQKLESCL